MKPKSIYHSMKAHDLARVTRERNLDKPKVITLSEWADFLDADDAKRAMKATDANRDTEDSSAQDIKDIGEKAVSTTTKKGKG
jgi:uncharacterized protein (DUF2147 family)